MDIDKELSDLKIGKDNPVEETDDKLEGIGEDESVGGFILDQCKNLSKKNKEKKKKKKKDKETKEVVHNEVVDEIGDSLFSLGISDIDNDDSILNQFKKQIKATTRKEKGKKIFDSDKFNESGGNKTTSKKKKIEREVDSIFHDELKMLDEVLGDAEKMANDSRAIFNDIKKVKQRGYSKVLTDVMTCVNASNNNRLAIIKERINVKKNKNDILLKRLASKNIDEGKTTSHEQLGSQFFSQLYGMGKKNVMSQIKEAQRNSVDLSGVDLETLKSFNGTQDYQQPESINNLDDEIEERLAREENLFRSAEGTKNIEYEQDGIDLKVELNADTNEWRIIAINKYNQRVDDYPVPTNESLGKMTFQHDAGIATDMFGRSYRIVEIIE